MRNKIVGISVLALGLTACGGSDSGGAVSDACNELSSETFSCDTMLNDLVAEGVQPLATEFKTELVELDSKVDAYCSSPDTNTKEAAKTAWSAAMVPLQKMQTMNFGPNADVENGLLSFYAWQTANPENIDAAIASNAQNDSGLSTIDNRKDLVTVEYVLFTDDGTYTYELATGDEDKTVVDNWIQGKTAADIQADRCEYAQLITEDLKSRSATLEASWNNFDLAPLSNSKQAAANEVTQAFFYADKQIKDAKVGGALPIKDDNVFDATKLESQFAKTSKEHLINNLHGLKHIFTAGSGVGIDDYLVEVGEESLSNEMINNIDNAIANLEYIDTSSTSLFEIIDSASPEQEELCKNAVSYDGVSNIEALCAFVNKTIKDLTDNLKEDFTLATDFTIPASASGDND